MIGLQPLLLSPSPSARMSDDARSLPQTRLQLSYESKKTLHCSDSTMPLRNLLYVSRSNVRHGVSDAVEMEQGCKDGPEHSSRWITAAKTNTDYLAI
jgi:hypothetical protein